MNTEEIAETIKLLHQFFKVDGAHHVSDCRVSTFVAHRKAKDGSDQEVTFTISDYGKRPAPAKRYLAELTWDGERAGGYQGDDLKEAFAIQSPFDKPPAVSVEKPIVNFITPPNQPAATKKPSDGKPSA
jgi:hypothetical protein